MNTEVEMKLWVPNVHLERLPEVMASLSLSEQPSKKVINEYLDTPDRWLQQHRCALRIRRLGEQWLQTFKTQGRGADGLHQRREWEWPLDSNLLNVPLLQSIEPELSYLKGFAWEQVEVLFSTNFSRRLWHFQTEDSFVELVLDLGKVLANSNEEHSEIVEPISEIELELKQGEQSILWTLASKLSEQLPLILSGLSKAERGYRLKAPKAWYQQALSLLDTPCQTPENILWALEVMRFVQLRDIVDIDMSPLEAKCRQWLRGYPNDRLQNLVDRCLDQGFQEADSTRLLGQKLLVELQKKVGGGRIYPLACTD
jgi:inorganic triphosphatase YgiF